MEHQKKNRKDKPNLDTGKKDPDSKPKNGEETPSTDSPYDVFSEIDTYQRKIESEWESNKKVYQDKIDAIMNKFINENELHVENDKNDGEIDTPKTEDLKKTLSQINEQAKNLTVAKPQNAFVINVPWPTKKDKLKFALKILSSVCAIVITIFALWYQLIRIPAITALPYTNTSEITINDNTAYIVDWFRKALYTHKLKRNLPIRKIENLPNPFATGFAFTPSSLFSVDGLNSKILTHNATGDHLVIDEVELPDKKIAGLYWDGTDLWTFGNKEKRLYQLRGNELTDIKAVYYLRKGYVTAFQLINNRVWILDGTTREIHVARLQDPLKILDSFDLDPFLYGGVPTGLHVVVDKEAWVLTTNPSQLIRIPMKKLVQSKPTDY